mgnify:CR=1 FL=1
MPSANNRETDRLLLLGRSASVRQLATMKKKPGAREGACAKGRNGRGVCFASRCDEAMLISSEMEPFLSIFWPFRPV